MDQARAAAEEAERLAGRLHYPVGEAAKAEAAGACAEDPSEAAELMDTARERWNELGRPLDAARCTLVQGRMLAKSDQVGEDALLNEAASEYERLDVPGLAARARELVT